MSKKFAMKSSDFILIAAIKTCELDLNVLIKGPF